MIPPQTFQLSDLGVICFLVVLEALLSADNALILAMMVRHLSPDKQRRALVYGLGGAFIFRFVAILIAASLIHLWWLQAIGALYLLGQTLRHFLQASKVGCSIKPQSFWRTVIAVELTDIAFATDSVLAAVSAVGEDSSKLWLIYSGAVIGVVLLRITAGALTRLISKYSGLEGVAYVIVGWAGVKLCFSAAHRSSILYTKGQAVFPAMSHGVFWVGTVAILTVGTFLAVRQQRSESPAVLDSSDLD